MNHKGAILLASPFEFEKLLVKIPFKNNVHSQYKMVHNTMGGRTDFHNILANESIEACLFVFNISNNSASKKGDDDFLYSLQRMSLDKNAEFLKNILNQINCDPSRSTGNPFDMPCAFVGIKLEETDSCYTLEQFSSALHLDKFPFKTLLVTTDLKEAQQFLEQKSKLPVQNLAAWCLKDVF